MLDSLITSKTRTKLLLKFFLNPETTGYLRELAAEFGESTNAVRVELNRLTDADLLTSSTEGRTRVYRANKGHPLFPDIRNIVAKTVGIDQLIERILSRLGNLKAAYIVGDYAEGMDSGLIDLVLIGEINHDNLDAYVRKAEEEIRRKIRVLVLDKNETTDLAEKLDLPHAICLWSADKKAQKAWARQTERSVHGRNL